MPFEQIIKGDSDSMIEEITRLVEAGFTPKAGSGVLAFFGTVKIILDTKIGDMTFLAEPEL